MSKLEQQKLLSSSDRVYDAFDITDIKNKPPWRKKSDYFIARMHRSQSFERIPEIGRDIITSGIAFLSNRTRDPFLQNIAYLLDRQMDLGQLKTTYVPDLQEIAQQINAAQPDEESLEFMRFIPLVYAIEFNDFTPGQTNGIGTYLPIEFVFKGKDRAATKLAQIAFLGSVNRDIIFNRGSIDPENIVKRAYCALAKIMRLALTQDPSIKFPEEFALILKNFTDEWLAKIDYQSPILPPLDPKAN